MSTPARSSTVELDKAKRMRKTVVDEVLSTEQSYVDSLGTLVLLMRKPLMAASMSSKPILNAQQIETLFSNVNMIYDVNKRFLDELEIRIRNWESVTSRPSIMVLGSMQAGM